MTARLALGSPLLLCLFFLTSGNAADDWPPKPVRIASKVSGHIHPAICVSKKGTVVVIFSQSDMKDLRISRSTDGGDTWSKPEPFAPSAKQSIYPGSLTTLESGWLGYAWDIWNQAGGNKKS